MKLVSQSLRGRLVVALLGLLVAVLGGWLCAYSAMLDRQQTGAWDSSLRVIAHQILLSLPGDVEHLSASQPPYRLPAGIEAGALDGRLSAHKPRFQVWLHGGREGFRSPGTPSAPLRADFVDGFADTDVAGERWRVYSVGDATGRVNVQVAWSHAQLDAERLRGLRLSIGAAAALFVLLAVPLWFIVGWSLRPVTAIRSAIRQREGLDLAPLPTAGLPREVAPLVDAFNQLLQRLDEALQGERRFIADAAHELRTPLAVLSAHADLARRAATEEERDTALHRLSAGVARAARLSEQLLDLARIDAETATPALALLDLAPLLVLVVRDFETLARERHQRISLRTEDGRIRGDVDQLGILIRNLIDNAVRYAGEGGHIEVICRRDVRDGVGGIALCVADDGPGVATSERESIFHRFYRANGGSNGPLRSSGSGIGLSLVARIARTHHATIHVEDGLDGKGLAVTVFFPAA